jgi:2-polyprenyl-3-methyl-5-hydroxy-6-metoxy-1,4-benzoquinol methylase
MAYQQPHGSGCFVGRCPEPRRRVARPSFGTVARCRRCGLVRVDPARSGDALIALHRTPGYFSHPYFAARRDLGSENLMRKHRAVLDVLTGGGPRSGARLLDIGCDTGSLLCVARDEFRMNVAGIEVSERAAEVARSRHGLDVAVSSAEQAALPPGSFDYITMIDLIEHVADPLALLVSTRRLLKPGGRLYIVTPNHDALIYLIGFALDRSIGRPARPLIEHLYIPWHEFYFDAHTITAALHLAGLSLCRADKREFPLDEFGHGMALKAMLWPVFQLQWLLSRQSLLEVVAERPA